MNDNQKFAEVLLAAGLVFNKDVGEALVKIYLKALEPHSPVECAAALERLIKTSKFMPKPGDILELLEGDTHGQALAAWPEVERLATNSAEAMSQNPVTETVVREMGGWVRFGKAEYREYPFLQREFLERYQTYQQTPKLLEQARQAQLGERTNETLRIGDIGHG